MKHTHRLLAALVICPALLLTGCGIRSISDEKLERAVRRAPLICPDPEQERQTERAVLNGVEAYSEPLEVCLWRAASIEEARVEARAELATRKRPLADESYGAPE